MNPLRHLAQLALAGALALIPVSASASSSEAPKAAFEPADQAGQVALFTGAAHHRIPLEIPTGAGNLSIPLALTYDSDRVSGRVGEDDTDGGWLGLGWRLDVGRVELTGGSVGDHRLVLDGSAAPLAYRGAETQTCSDADGWTCDEQRLQSYDTEEARFWRIEKTTRTWRRAVCACDLACGGAPTTVDGLVRDDSMFQVWNRAGVRYDFGVRSFEDLPWNTWVGSGASTSSRAYHLRYRDGVGPDHKEAWYRAWGLEKVVDPSGNTIDVEYQSFTSNVWSHNCGGLPDRGWKEVYPRRILYTTNPAAGDHHAEWEVELLMSEKSFDTRDDYGIAQSGVILDAVRVWFHPLTGGSELVREYRFEYETDLSEAKKSYRLRRVRHFGLGGEASGPEMPATELAYTVRGVRWNGTDRERYFLSQVSDPHGATVSFDYVDFDATEYRKQVVQSRIIDPGLGPVDSRNYAYFEPKSKTEDDGTQRLIGFGRVEETRWNRLEISHFHATAEDDEHPLNGKRFRHRTEALDGTALDQREWDWLTTQRTRPGTSTPAGWFVRVGEERDYQWDIHGTESSRKRVFSHNPADQGGEQYGNVVAVLEFDDAAATTPWRSTWRPHAVDPAAWIVDRPRLEAIYEGNLFSGPYASLKRFIWKEGDTPNHHLLGDRGLLWSEVSYVTVDGGERTLDTRHAYDAFGNRVATTTFGDYGYDGSYATAEPRTTTVDYDPHHTLPIRTTNALGHVEESYYYGHAPASSSGTGLPGQIQATRDANGVWTARNAYDSFGRPSHLWRPGNSAWSPSDAAETWTYDDVERWQRHSRRGDDGSAIATLDSWSFFDGLGRTVQIQQRWNASQKQMTQLHYDADGRMTRKVLPRVHTWSDDLFHAAEWNRDDRPAERFEYDELGRRTAEVAVDGSREVFEPGPWGQETRIPATGKRRETHLVDARSHAVRTTVLDPSTFDLLTTYREYDVLDNLRRVWMSAETETVFERDELGRITSEDDPNRGFTAFYHDPAGNLVEQVNAAGERVCHYYDLLERPVARWQTTASCPSTAPAGSTRLVWDEGTHGIGRLSRVERYWGSLSFAYDARGRRTSETFDVVADGVLLTTNRTFDEADRVRTLTYPDGTTAVHDYDPVNGLPITLIVNGQPIATGAVYTQRGELKSLDWGNGLQTRWGFYDETGAYRLESIRTGPASQIDRDQYVYYGYDADGQITLRRDYRGPGTGWYEQEDFDYDYLDRLTRASTINPSLAPYDLEYRYDSLGRLDQVTDHVAGSVSSRDHSVLHPHALETVNGATVYSYDDAGRATWRRSGGVDWNLDWDFENRLWRATSAAGTVLFDYDHEERPIRRQAPDATTYFLGDFEQRVTATGVETVSHLRFGDQRVALRRQMASGATQFRYQHRDRLGSTQLATDEAGSVVHRTRYFPFGGERWSAGAAESEIAFAGERRVDDLGGLYRMGVRLYDPEHRQWATPDTIIPDILDVEKLDRYAYVTHNPLRLVDPSGHDGEDPAPMISAEAGAAAGWIATAANVGFMLFRVYATIEYYEAVSEARAQWYEAGRETPGLMPLNRGKVIPPGLYSVTEAWHEIEGGAGHPQRTASLEPMEWANDDRPFLVVDYSPHTIHSGRRNGSKPNLEPATPIAYVPPSAAVTPVGLPPALGPPVPSGPSIGGPLQAP